MTCESLFEKVRSRKDLTIDESRETLSCIVDQQWTEAETEIFLITLHDKGESADEIVGFASAMRERAIPVADHELEAIDTCGTGGDRKSGFNISTLVAFVLAGCGIPVVKHGNRGASSDCGSADLLEALGIRCRLRPDEAAASLRCVGFAFLFAPDYHPAAKSVAAVRRRIGKPTIFNLLGPLTNPARPCAQLIGVYDRRALPLLAEAIRIMDPHKRAALLHSSQGWDEATPSGTFYLQSTAGTSTEVSPADLGFKPCSEEELRGGKPAENAEIANAVLAGEPGACRDTVLLNAMLAYEVFYPECTRTRALCAVQESLDSGAARSVVENLKARYPL